MSLLLFALVGCTVNVGVRDGTELSAANKYLLSHPGAFFVTVNTKPHPEDRRSTVVPLPVPSIHLQRAVEGALKEAGVPTQDQKSGASEARGLVLKVWVSTEDDRFYYDLGLSPDFLPDDPREVYDYVWPSSLGHAEKADLPLVLQGCAEALAQAFARIYDSSWLPTAGDADRGSHNVQPDSGAPESEPAR